MGLSMRRSGTLFVFLLMLFSSLPVFSAVPAQPIVFVQEPDLRNEGSQANIRFWIKDVADLYGYDVDLSYNPVAAQYQSLTYASFLTSDGASHFTGTDLGLTQISNGNINNVVELRSGTATGVSGSWEIFRVAVNNLNNGAADFTVKDVQLSDSQGVAVPNVGVIYLTIWSDADVGKPDR